jgi:hypothetical protein
LQNEPARQARTDDIRYQSYVDKNSQYKQVCVYGILEDHPCIEHCIIEYSRDFLLCDSMLRHDYPADALHVKALEIHRFPNYEFSPLMFCNDESRYHHEIEPFPRQCEETTRDKIHGMLLDCYFNAEKEIAVHLRNEYYQSERTVSSIILPIRTVTRLCIDLIFDYQFHVGYNEKMAQQMCELLRSICTISKQKKGSYDGFTSDLSHLSYTETVAHYKDREMTVNRNTFEFRSSESNKILVVALDT